MSGKPESESKHAPLGHRPAGFSFADLLPDRCDRDLSYRNRVPFGRPESNLYNPSGKFSPADFANAVEVVVDLRIHHPLPFVAMWGTDLYRKVNPSILEVTGLRNPQLGFTQHGTAKNPVVIDVCNCNFGICIRVS